MSGHTTPSQSQALEKHAPPPFDPAHSEDAKELANLVRTFLELLDRFAGAIEPTGPPTEEEGDASSAKISTTLNAGFRPDDAAAYIGLKRWKFFEVARTDPKFPRPIRYSQRSVIYRREDLDNYLAEKVAEEVAL